MGFRSPDDYRRLSVRYASGVAAAEAAMQKQQLSGWAQVPMLVDIDRGRQAAEYGGNAGVAVTDETAMRLSTVFACARLLCSTAASLPLPVYRRGSDGIAKPATDVPLYRVLHDSPNADQSPIDYLEFLFLSLLFRGNHYALKIRDSAGSVAGLDPIRPDIVQVSRAADGRVRYRWTTGGDHYDLSEDDVFHVRGFGGGPLGGLSTIAYARESLGIAIAADRSAGAMFRNGVKASGVLKFKEWLPEDKRAEARADIAERFAGASNTGRPFVLEGGSDWQQISINPDDAQLLESRGWAVEDICRWFGVPPFMIGHNEKTTSWGTGIEQMLLGFQKFTLNPYLRRIEQAVRKQLLTDEERVQGLFAEFNLEGLLRADSEARSKFYQAALGDTQKPGWMVRNEVRRLENLEPIAGWDEPTPLLQQTTTPAQTRE